MIEVSEMASHTLGYFCEAVTIDHWILSGEPLAKVSGNCHRSFMPLISTGLISAKYKTMFKKDTKYRAGHVNSVRKLFVHPLVLVPQ